MRSKQLSAAEFFRLLEETGALHTGHFLLSSGRHSPQYIQCAQLLQHPDLAALACTTLGDRFRSARPELVIGPAMGGIIVAHEVGRALSARVLFAERVDGRFALRRLFEIDRGERVLIVEDVVTTGGSIHEVADLVMRAGGEIVGMCALVDRTGGASVFPMRFESLIALTVPTFAASDCPQCAEGAPVNKPGSRTMPTLSAR
jgi:orotate phosphoribosyltransferase